MRELISVHLPSRVHGRQVLARRLRGLHIAVHRFARCRARSAADHRWAARLVDALAAALAVADAADPGPTHTYDHGEHRAPCNNRPTKGPS